MLLKQIKKGENKKLELKKTLPSTKKIAKTVVANLFRKLKYIESWGSGIEKIKKLCKQSKLKFELKEKPSFVSVVFYRESIPIENCEKVPDTDELLLKEQKILKFLQNNEKIYVKYVERLLNLKTTQSKEILYKLVNKGILEKIGKTKRTYYILKAEYETKI